MIQQELQNNLNEVTLLMKSHKVRKTYAFGSVCADDFTKDSDIDFLISFDKNLDPVEYGTLYFNLANELEKLLNRPVDLLTDYALKNPYFIKEINATKVALYE